MISHKSCNFSLQSSAVRSLVRQRKIVSSFRDESLKSLFTLGLSSVKQLSATAVNSNSGESARCYCHGECLCLHFLQGANCNVHIMRMHCIFSFSQQTFLSQKFGKDYLFALIGLGAKPLCWLGYAESPGCPDKESWRT